MLRGCRAVPVAVRSHFFPKGEGSNLDNVRGLAAFFLSCLVGAQVFLVTTGWPAGGRTAGQPGGREPGRGRTGPASLSGDERRSRPGSPGSRRRPSGRVLIDGGAAQGGRTPDYAGADIAAGRRGEGPPCAVLVGSGRPGGGRVRPPRDASELGFDETPGRKRCPDGSNRTSEADDRLVRGVSRSWTEKEVDMLM